MISLLDELESNFDLSDVDGAMQLAYAALRLAARAAFAIESDNANSLVGRDQKADLSMAILTVAQRLHLIPYSPDSTDVLGLFEALENCR